jgi:NADPH2:quinone reductase
LKAVRVQKIGLEHPMRVEEIPGPVPEAGELRVRVEAAGVNPHEIAVRDGSHPLAQAKDYPYICGMDLAGTVEAVGPGVPAEGPGGFVPGHRVWGRSSKGAYAERAILAAATSGRLPDRYSFNEGACLPVPLFTAWCALVLMAEARAGETVLVQGGAGGVGQVAIQLAKRMGCRVLATVSTEEKAGFCLTLGADEIINYKEEEVVPRVLELTAGRGAGVVVENAARDNLDADIALLAQEGRIVLVGPGTGKEPSTSLNVQSAMGKNARILGLATAGLGPRVPEAIRRLSPLLEAGGLRLHVGLALSLEEAEEAHRVLLSGKFLGKIVLVP